MLSSSGHYVSVTARCDETGLFQLVFLLYNVESIAGYPLGYTASHGIDTTQKRPRDVIVTVYPPEKPLIEWLECATDNRVVAGSKPNETSWKPWQFPLPHFASVFRKIH